MGVRPHRYGRGLDAHLRLRRHRPLRRCRSRRRWQGPSIGIDDQSQTVVGWTIQAADLDVWIRGFGTDGTDTGRMSAQRLSSVTAGRQEQMVVAVSPYAEVAVAYTDDNDGNTYDQIHLGLDISNNNW